jgi:hypothetical protein
VPDNAAPMPRSATSIIMKTSRKRAQSGILKHRRTQEFRKPLFTSTVLRPSHDLSADRLARRRQDRIRLTMHKRAWMKDNGLIQASVTLAMSHESSQPLSN